MKPIVAIVGRPNVGKSTLFNRLIQKRLAIIEDTPGVTRDRIYADAEWNGREFTLIDTGGIQTDEAEGGPSITAQVRRQAELAMAEADVVVFLVDARDGLTPTDEEVAGILRRVKRPVILVANKADNLKVEGESVEFFALGLGEPFPISAAHGVGTGDLLDQIVEKLPEAVAEPEDDSAVKVAVIGRPNVGKSSLVNAVLGEERVIVSDIPGTTRDAIDVLVQQGDVRYLFIDTAGMRRRAKIDESVERYSVMRSLRAVDRSDVVLMVIDALDGATDQDRRIAGYADEAGKAMVLVINKWDLIEKDDKTMSRYRDEIRAGLPFLAYAPMVFLSAKTHQRVNRIIPTVAEVSRAQNLQIQTRILNDVISEALTYSPPPAERGKRLKIYYCTQAGVKPPTFLLFCNDPELMTPPYRRYLEKRLRGVFYLEGTPVRLVMKRRE